MPYDPNLPQNGQPLNADTLRPQLQGLFEAISSIPKGDQGDPGIQGIPGDTGAQGPPFAQAIIDAVSTLDPGQPATAQVGFDGNNVHFTFGIPRGETGGTGDQGQQGPPGEVTLGQMQAATSANTNSVSTLDTTFTNDPPTLADFEALRSKVNELILALRH